MATFTQTDSCCAIFSNREARCKHFTRRTNKNSNESDVMMSNSAKGRNETEQRCLWGRVLHLISGRFRGGSAPVYVQEFAVLVIHLGLNLLTQLPEGLLDALGSESDRAVAVPTLSDCPQDYSHCLRERE